MRTVFMSIPTTMLIKVKLTKLNRFTISAKTVLTGFFIFPAP